MYNTEIVCNQLTKKEKKKSLCFQWLGQSRGSNSGGRTTCLKFESDLRDLRRVEEGRFEWRIVIDGRFIGHPVVGNAQRRRRKNVAFPKSSSKLLGFSARVLPGQLLCLATSWGTLAYVCHASTAQKYFTVRYLIIHNTTVSKLPVFYITFYPEK